MTRQCPSCGGFCKKSGCERENVKREQEPVAWVLHGELFWPSEYEVISEAGDNAIPLYITPPKREWVGLTEGEFRAIGDGFENDNGHIPSWMIFARAIETKLKEKNT